MKRKYNVKVSTGKYLVLSEYVIKMMMMMIMTVMMMMVMMMMMMMMMMLMMNHNTFISALKTHVFTMS